MNFMWIILTTLIGASCGEIENSVYLQLGNGRGSGSGTDSGIPDDSCLLAMNDSTTELKSTLLDVQDAIENGIDSSLATSVGDLQTHVDNSVLSGVETLLDAIKGLRNELSNRLNEQDGRINELASLLANVSCMVASDKVYYNGQCYDCEIFGGVCYTFVQERVSWDDARSKCKELGGDLVVMQSQEEYDFITTMAADTIWIGLTDEAMSGQFMWIDGTAFDSAAFSGWWGTGYPAVNQGECVGMANGNMGNQRCTILFGYICEIEP